MVKIGLRRGTFEQDGARTIKASEIGGRLLISVINVTCRNRVVLSVGTWKYHVSNSKLFLNPSHHPIPAGEWDYLGDYVKIGVGD